MKEPTTSSPVNTRAAINKSILEVETAWVRLAGVLRQQYRQQPLGVDNLQRDVELLRKIMLDMENVWSRWDGDLLITKPFSSDGEAA